MDQHIHIPTAEHHVHEVPHSSPLSIAKPPRHPAATPSSVRDQHSGYLFGTSPKTSLGVNGTSPQGSSLSKSVEDEWLGAKRFYKRLLYDPHLNRDDVEIGLVEVVESDRRKSGAEAWSLRQHQQVRLIPCNVFQDRYCSAAPADAAGPAPDPPFHRIAFFRDRHAGTVLWERKTTVWHRQHRASGSDGHAGSPPAISAAHLSPSSLTAQLSGRSPGGSRGSSPGPHPGSLGSAGGGLSMAFAALGSSPNGSRGASPGLRMSPGLELRGANAPRPVRLAAFFEGGAGAGRRGAHEEGSPDPPEGGHVHPPATSACEGVDEGTGDWAGDVLLGEEALRREADEAWAADDYEDEEEEEALDLPDDIWRTVLELLPVRELCMVSRVNRRLRALTAEAAVWRERYFELYGERPAATLELPLIRRLCRRTELAASRWRDASPQQLPTGYPHTVALALDDSKVISADGGVVRLWSHTSGRRLQTLTGHAGRVTAVSFDDPSAYILSGCSNNQVRLWSLEDGKCLKSLRGHTGPITGVQMQAGGVPISSSADGTVRVWDAAQGHQVAMMNAQAPVECFALHRPSSHLYTGSDHIGVWNLDTAQLLQGMTLPEAVQLQYSPAAVQPFVALSSEGPLLAAGSLGSIALFDTRANEFISAIAACHVTGAAAALPVSLQLDGWKLLAAARDGSHAVRLFDIRALDRNPRKAWDRPVMEFSCGGDVACFRAFGGFLLAGLANGEPCRLWNFTTGLRCSSTLGPTGHSGSGSHHYGGNSGSEYASPAGGAGGFDREDSDSEGGRRGKGNGSGGGSGAPSNSNSKKKSAKPSAKTKFPKKGGGKAGRINMK